jgi:hypothetical protein
VSQRTLFAATDMLIFGAFKRINEVCCHTISKLWLFQAVLLLAQDYTMHTTAVVTAPRRQCHKQTLFVATDMQIFSAFKLSKSGVCCCTISRLWLFQAILLLAQHYTMHLTTVTTAPRRQCYKRTLFVATDMQIFSAVKLSKNGVCFYTISRL